MQKVSSMIGCVWFWNKPEAVPNTGCGCSNSSWECTSLPEKNHRFAQRWAVPAGVWQQWPREIPACCSGVDAVRFLPGTQQLLFCHCLAVLLARVQQSSLFGAVFDWPFWYLTECPTEPGINMAILSRLDFCLMNETTFFFSHLVKYKRMTGTDCEHLIHYVNWYGQHTGSSAFVYLCLAFN